MRGKAAFGARYLKKGFSFSAEDDLAWALGYPHLRILTDERDGYFERWKVGYPLSEEYRALSASGHCRGGSPGAYRFVPGSRTAFQDWPKRAKAFLADEAPITAEIAHTIITSHVRMEAIEKSFVPQTFPAFVYELEALVGPEPVAWALLDALKALELSDFRRGEPTLYEIVGTLGFLRLRMRTAQAEKLTTELQALLDAVVITLPGKKLVELKSAKDGAHAYRMLDLILNGAQAVLRSADGAKRYAPAGRLVFAGDDPDCILEQLGKAKMGLARPCPVWCFWPEEVCTTTSTAHSRTTTSPICGSVFSTCWIRTAESECPTPWRCCCVWPYWTKPTTRRCSGSASTRLTLGRCAASW